MTDTKTTNLWKQAGLAFVVLAIGVVVAIALTLTRQLPAKQAIETVNPLVKVMTLKRRDVPVVVRGFGTVRPNIAVQIVPQVEGRAIRIHPALRAGGFFRSHEVLIHIDPTDYELALASAKAGLAQTEATLASAIATVAEFQARVADAQLEAIRVRQFFDRTSATRYELDKAELAIKRTDAQLKAAIAMRDRALAACALAQTQLEVADVELDRTTIAAPFDGRVMSEKVDVGQFVVAGQSLAQIYRTDVMEIMVPLEDWQLSWFDLPGARNSEQSGAALGASGNGHGSFRGAAATVSTRFSGKKHCWTGYVARVESEIDPTSRMVNVVVEVPEPMATGDRVMLMPGMFAEVVIHGTTLHKVFEIPRHTLHLDGKVWVAMGDTLRFLDVQIARSDGDRVYVNGPSDGQLLITTALDIVTDGMKIRTVHEDAAINATGPSPVTEMDQSATDHTTGEEAEPPP